jgi:hypothetical protein
MSSTSSGILRHAGHQRGHGPLVPLDELPKGVHVAVLRARDQTGVHAHGNGQAAAGSLRSGAFARSAAVADAKGGGAAEVEGLVRAAADASGVAGCVKA